MSLAVDLNGYGFLHFMYKMPEHSVKNIHNDSDLIEYVKKNFRSIHAKNFIDFTELSLNVWSRILPISKRTLQRELDQKENHFEIKISEPLVEVGEIYSLGLEAFDKNKKRLNDWLDTPNSYFNGKKPLDIMDSHKGRDLVKSALHRIEYSEFS